MSEEKKICPDPYRLYSPDDLSKKWFVYYYVEGKRIRVYGDINKKKTKKARFLAAQQLISELDERRVGDGQTIKERVYRWLEDQKNIWKKTTYDSYLNKIDIFYRRMGNFTTKEKIESFIKEIRKNRHPTTYNTYVVTLRKVFREIDEFDLVKDLRPVKSTKTPARYFMPGHVDMIKSYLLKHDPELWLFIQFIFYCFIRPGELRQLKVSDVLLDEKKILIRSELSKNRKMQYVAIPEAFESALHSLRNKRPGDYIFPGTRAGKHISRNAMWNRHNKMLRELGFSNEFKLYSWKHTGAVMAVKAGVGVKELQMQLRHHSLDQVNEYLRQMGVWDMDKLRNNFPEI